MAAAGLTGLLITAPSADLSKLARVVTLNRDADVMVTVDHPSQVSRLLEALQPGDPPLRLVIDTDIGHARTGITDVAAGVRLAQTIVQQPQLALAGVQGYAGHIQHIADARERKAAAAGCSERLRIFTDALETAGLAPALVSGSGTGAFLYERDGPYTELQVGSYVFMDAEYAKILDEDRRPPQFMPSLFVLTTVVSANRPGQVTVDVGTKSLATNGPPPCILLGAPAGSTYHFAGDEHGIISVPREVQPPPLGSRLLIGATHCDPTVNLHSAYHVVREDGLEKWPILARH
jgi:D-serine deaminase-like pyridoxal phosphate-dependent protein